MNQTSRPTILRQLFWFITVGTSAALVHWLVVITFVSLWHWPPLGANVIGWLIAFLFSFSGHHLLTFRYQGASARQAMRRFFLLSAGGFVINEVSYAILLHTTTLNYQWLLAIILIGVAFLTFFISKFWAFRRTVSSAPKR